MFPNIGSQLAQRTVIVSEGLMLVGCLKLACLWQISVYAHIFIHLLSSIISKAIDC